MIHRDSYESNIRNNDSSDKLQIIIKQSISYTTDQYKRVRNHFWTSSPKALANRSVEMRNKRKDEGINMVWFIGSIGQEEGKQNGAIICINISRLIMIMQYRAMSTEINIPSYNTARIV